MEKIGIDESKATHGNKGLGAMLIQNGVMMTNEGSCYIDEVFSFIDEALG